MSSGGPYREKDAWVATGSLIAGTEQFRLLTEGGIELVLTRAPSGAWVFTCEQLWGDAKVVTVGPSDMGADLAKMTAIRMAIERMTELARSLFSSANRALGRAV